MPPVVAIVGPTAVGKSGLALNLAAGLHGSVVSADSRQVYRYMDIGTDKPSLEQRARVPHYMLDIVAPDDVFTLQRYVEEGTRVLRAISKQGRVALVVGGTGFYIRGLLDGISVPEVPPEPELRARLQQEAKERGSQVLHQRLSRLDPQSANRIHANNLPRVIRALEIIELTGRPVPVPPDKEVMPALFIGLKMDRDKLREAATRRIDDQIRRGLVAETEQLLAMGFQPSLPALDGFGYRQMIAHLQGRVTLDQAIADYGAATFKYIRRQMTWFRADPRIHWIDAGNEAAGEASRLIERHLRSASTANVQMKVHTPPNAHAD